MSGGKGSIQCWLGEVIDAADEMVGSEASGYTLDGYGGHCELEGEDEDRDENSGPPYLKTLLFPIPDFLQSKNS